MGLYAVTIRGYKYYFSGNLTSEAINAIESFCQNLERNSKSVDAVALFDRLISYISSELGLPISPVNVEHVFRINY